jgi:DNA-binding HxlR family transcriptional regulator
MNWRLRRAWRSRTRPPQVERDLTARLEHLESVVEALQDALYRQAQQHDRDVADLRKRTDPAELARALSADARRRGL